MLEAFGNAKTFKNNNSSRFGKFIKVNFGAADLGKVHSARITSYLLEKSRVVMQLQNERNFHVFYQVLQTPEYQRKYKLKPIRDYNYVNQSGLESLPDVDDAKEMQLTIACMQNINFSPELIEQAVNIVVAILNLGNITFEDRHQAGKGSCAAIKEESAEYVEQARELLGLEDQEQVRQLLCTKSQTMLDEKLTIDLQTREALVARDSVSKHIYMLLFTWLVDRVNQSISLQQTTSKKGLSNKASKFIGILDIFGFEIFKDNSFEQLLINYANEKL